jgi:hypothetical protein
MLQSGCGYWAFCFLSFWNFVIRLMYWRVEYSFENPYFGFRPPQKAEAVASTRKSNDELRILIP